MTLDKEPAKKKIIKKASVAATQSSAAFRQPWMCICEGCCSHLSLFNLSSLARQARPNWHTCLRITWPCNFPNAVLSMLLNKVLKPLRNSMEAVLTGRGQG